MGTRERHWTSLFLALMVYLGHVHPEETAVTKDCSCYTFHGSETLSWTESRNECNRTGGDLVSMETKKEWQFIRDQIQDRWTAKNEWHIGLKKTNGMWAWVSGSRLNWAECNSTGCFPWQKGEPSGWPENVGLVAKDYPANTKGLFNDVTADDIKIGFICEQVKDTCEGGIQRCLIRKPRIMQRTTPGNPVFPTTTILPTTSEKPKSKSAVTSELMTEESRRLDRTRTTVHAQSPTRSRGTATNKLRTGKHWELDRKSTIVPSQSPLPTTTRKLTFGGTVTNKPSIAKLWEFHTRRSKVPTQSNERPTESPNTVIIVITSTAAALMMILSVMVALLWRRRFHKRHRGSIRLKKKSNARTAVQPRGQLTFVFDGDRVYATVDWSKKTKRKKQEEFVYSDLTTGEVEDEAVRWPAPYVSTIYAGDIRSTWEPDTANHEGATNTREANTSSKKLFV